MGRSAIRLSIAIILATAGTAHADDYSNLVNDFKFETAECRKATATARATLAAYETSTDPAFTVDLASLRDAADSTDPYCTGLQSYVDGLPQVVADYAVCNHECVADQSSSACRDVLSRQACDQVEPVLSDSSNKLMGWIQVIALSSATIQIADDDITNIEHTRACDKGDGNACGELGDAYATGTFARRSSKDAKKYWKLAIKLLDKQCTKGKDHSACGYIASAYEDGGFGVSVSKAKAKKYRALETKYAASTSSSDAKLDDMFGK